MILSRIALPRDRGEHGRLDRERHSRPNLSDQRSPITERRTPNAERRSFLKKLPKNNVCHFK
jgi:hypothetical protein